MPSVFFIAATVAVATTAAAGHPAAAILHPPQNASRYYNVNILSRRLVAHRRCFGCKQSVVDVR